MKRSRTLIVRSLAALLVALVLTASATTPASAYGKDNWQIGFSGTATMPTTGQGFGFWGWCAFKGVASGTDGDCEVAQYLHGPAGTGFTCEESIDISAWTAATGTFVILAATATVRPSSLTAECLSFFPGPGGFPADTEIPARPGHYSLQLVPGLPGSLQIQVTLLP